MQLKNESMSSKKEIFQNIFLSDRINRSEFDRACFQGNYSNVLFAYITIL